MECAAYSAHPAGSCDAPLLPQLDDALGTADALERYFRRHPRYDIGTGGTRRFLTTGQPGPQSDLVARFWGAPLSFEAA